MSLPEGNDSVLHTLRNWDPARVSERKNDLINVYVIYDDLCSPRVPEGEELETIIYVHLVL